METGTIVYISKSNEWFRVEEKLSSRPRLLGYACSFMFNKKKMFDEVFSINQRH